MQQFFIGENQLEIKSLSDIIFRVRYAKNGNFHESLLSRYNIINEPSNDNNTTVEVINETLYIKDIIIKLSLLNEGYQIQFSLDENERIFGFGDMGRESIQKRGTKLKLWQTNVTGYGPIPYFMSSKGWGVLVNTTFAQDYDVGCDIKDKITVSVASGTIDFYIFISDSMTGALELYTDIAGKPVMLPKFAYGFNFVSNEENGAREVLTDCYQFRQEGIPCDMVGLEPGWMEKHYDFSVNKRWHPTRFYFPEWLPINYYGTWSWIYSLQKLGFSLSLWLCCDYDLLWEEEKTRLEVKQNDFEGATIADKHFSSGVVMDQITKPGEAWFEHLKKFVDQGAAAFKLDGSNQVLEHPDRIWAGKYRDDEVHNVYPVIYAKQMTKGFEEYTGKRSLIYTPSAYAGTQQFAATWAGDTGGGPATVVSVLNFSMCGHSNSSCDLEPTDPITIHYGFLMPWSQLLGWRNWHQPWFLGPELKNCIKDYARLRSSLFPYIYSMAHKAAATGIALARPLALMHPDDDAYDNVSNLYYLGDSLLVGVFDMNFTLPPGMWYDYFTGERYSGTVNYVPPKGKGGGLFVKDGAIVVTQEPMQYVNEKYPDVYHVNVYPGADCSFTLVDDDGITYDYRDGVISETKFEISNTTETDFDFTIYKRQGSYTANDVNDIEVIIHGWDKRYIVTASERRDKDLTWHIKKELN